MPLIIKKRPDEVPVTTEAPSQVSLAPWEGPAEIKQLQDTSVVQAIKEWAKSPEYGLMLTKNDDGSCYIVLAYDESTRRTKLQCPNGSIIAPVITERESQYYSVVKR